MAADQDYKWDIFISYDRERFEWVNQNLLRALNEYRLAGRPLRIFLDKETIEVGTDGFGVTIDALDASRRVVAIYTERYFERDMCKLELKKAFDRDMFGSRGVILPLLVEDVAKKIPRTVDHLQFIDVVRDPHWFDRLVKRLDLDHFDRVTSLRFVKGPADVLVNQTIPEIRVAVECEGSPSSEEEVITLLSEKGTLKGTVSVRSKSGRASFPDLFIDSAVDQTRLVATADGCSAAFSEIFNVSSAQPVVPEPTTPLLPVEGEPIFLNGAIAIISRQFIHIFGLDAEVRSRVALPAEVPMRFVRHTDRGLLAVTWSGDVHFLTPTGDHSRWAVPMTGEFRVIGDVASGAESLYVGTWSGEIYRLAAGTSPIAEFAHPSGVQSLVASADRLYICGLDGALCVYEAGRLQHRVKVEPSIHLLKLYPGYLVIVGEHTLYQFDLAQNRLLNQPLQFRVASAWGAVGRCVAVAADGRGVVFGPDMLLEPFHASAGAVPTSADRECSHCVLRNSDSTYSLLLNRRRLAYQHPGPLAVSPDAKYFSVSEPGGFKIVTGPDFARLVPRESGD